MKFGFVQILIVKKKVGPKQKKGVQCGKIIIGHKMGFSINE
jgi:hypothetical protein